jgi:hypothetical protein
VKDQNANNDRLSSLAEGYFLDAESVKQYFDNNSIKTVFIIQPCLCTKKVKTLNEAMINLGLEQSYPGYNRFYTNFLDIIVGLNKIKQLPIYEVADEFDNYEGPIYWDYVHVSSVGNRMIASRIANLLEKAGYLDIK